MKLSMQQPVPYEPANLEQDLPLIWFYVNLATYPMILCQSTKISSYILFDVICKTIKKTISNH